MTDAATLARRLYSAYQARDWATARSLLHPDAQTSMPATGERLEGRAAIVALNEGYPEPWGDLAVLRVVEGTDAVACEIEIVAAHHVYRCAAFWRIRDGLLADSVEYWVTVGADAPGPRPD